MRESGLSRCPALLAEHGSATADRGRPRAYCSGSLQAAGLSISERSPGSVDVGDRQSRFSRARSLRMRWCSASCGRGARRRPGEPGSGTRAPSPALQRATGPEPSQPDRLRSRTTPALRHLAAERRPAPVTDAGRDQALASHPVLPDSATRRPPVTPSRPPKRAYPLERPRVVHTHALLPSWSETTVHEGAWLSSTMTPPAATAAAIRCSAISGGTQTSMWNR